MKNTIKQISHMLNLLAKDRMDDPLFAEVVVNQWTSRENGNDMPSDNVDLGSYHLYSGISDLNKDWSGHADIYLSNDEKDNSRSPMSVRQFLDKLMMFSKLPLFPEKDETRLPIRLIHNGCLGANIKGISVNVDTTAIALEIDAFEYMD